MVVRRKPRTVEDFIGGSPDSAAVENTSVEEVSLLRAEVDRLKAQEADSQEIRKIATDQLHPLKISEELGQPRKYFSPTGMARLESSIRHKGIQEPLLIRESPTGLQIVSGERRWRCAVQIGLPTVPCIVKLLSDEEALEIALIANLMREDLNPIEETDNLIGLISLKLNFPKQDVSSSIIHLKNARQRNTLDDDKSRLIKQIEGVLEAFSITLDTFVSNRLPLLNLPQHLLEAVRSGDIEFSKAQLIARTSEHQHQQLLKKTIAEGLTKEALKEHIKVLKAKPTSKEAPGLRDSIHSTYQQLRSKKIWRKVESDSRLRSRVENLEKEMMNILEVISKVENQ